MLSADDSIDVGGGKSRRCSLASLLVGGAGRLVVGTFGSVGGGEIGGGLLSCRKGVRNRAGQGMSAGWRRMTSSASFEAALAAATVVARRASMSLIVLASVVETAALIALSREVGPLSCVLPSLCELPKLAAC